MESEYKVYGLVTLEQMLSAKNVLNMPLVETYENIKGTRFKKKVSYYNVPAAFDTEASSFYYNGEKAACMYIWQLGINGYVIVGRIWDEYYDAIKKIKEALGLNETKRLIVYVHNLAYDFQWIKDRHHWDDIFAREKGIPMKARCGGMEFRCSYILSGKSLENTCKDLTKYKVEKKVGDLDYDLVRTPITKLSETEIGYCIYDIICVMNYIQEQIELYGDITKIPLTNTGRVRKYCRDKCFSAENRKAFKCQMSRLTIGSVQELEMLKLAFAGGYTHANYMNANEVCENVASKDFTSSYPAQIVCGTYPMSEGEWIKFNSIKQIEKISEFYYVIFNVEIEGIKEIPGTPDHYISASKCFAVKNERTDNGRLISADRIQMCITSDDWEIISKCYTCESVKVGKAIRYHLDYLPRPFVQCVLDFYKDKTTLKGIESELVNYMLKKGYANSTYGMMVDKSSFEDLNLTYNNGEWKENPGSIEDALEQYNTSKNRFLFFPWGLRVTSLSRKALWLGGILPLGQAYIYADTDSVKYFYDDGKHEHIFEEYNKELNEKMMKACKTNKLNFEDTRPKTIKGVEKPLGVWDEDGMYKKFKTLGAKRYMYEDENGEIHITIAGLNKKLAAQYIASQEDPFDFFNDKMTIDEDHSGRTTHTHIMKPYSFECVDYQGNYYKGEEYSGIHIEKSKYNMKLSPIYMELLDIKEKYSIS